MYDCGMDATFTLAAWESMTAPQQLDAMLSAADVDSVEHMVRRNGLHPCSQITLSFHLHGQADHMSACVV